MFFLFPRLHWRYCAEALASRLNLAKKWLALSATEETFTYLMIGYLLWLLIIHPAPRDYRGTRLPEVLRAFTRQPSRQGSKDFLTGGPPVPLTTGAPSQGLAKLEPAHAVMRRCLQGRQEWLVPSWSSWNTVRDGEDGRVSARFGLRRSWVGWCHRTALSPRPAWPPLPVSRKPSLLTLSSH